MKAFFQNLLQKAGRTEGSSASAGSGNTEVEADATNANSHKSDGAGEPAPPEAVENAHCAGIYLSLELGDFIPHIPKHLLKPGKYDLHWPLLFDMGEIGHWVAEGTSTIPLSTLLEAVPEIFADDAAREYALPIRFAWQKVWSMMKKSEAERESGVETLEEQLRRQVKLRKTAAPPAERIHGGPRSAGVSQDKRHAPQAMSLEQARSETAQDLKVGIPLEKPSTIPAPLTLKMDAPRKNAIPEGPKPPPAIVPSPELKRMNLSRETSLPAVRPVFEGASPSPPFIHESTLDLMDLSAGPAALAPKDEAQRAVSSLLPEVPESAPPLVELPEPQRANDPLPGVPPPVSPPIVRSGEPSAADSEPAFDLMDLRPETAALINRSSPAPVPKEQTKHAASHLPEFPEPKNLSHGAPLPAKPPASPRPAADAEPAFDLMDLSLETESLITTSVPAPVPKDQTKRAAISHLPQFPEPASLSPGAPLPAKPPAVAPASPRSEPDSEPAFDLMELSEEPPSLAHEPAVVESAPRSVELRESKRDFSQETRLPTNPSVIEPASGIPAPETEPAFDLMDLDTEIPDRPSASVPKIESHRASEIDPPTASVRAPALVALPESKRAHVSLGTPPPASHGVFEQAKASAPSIPEPAFDLMDLETEVAKSTAPGNAGLALESQNSIAPTAESPGKSGLDEPAQMAHAARIADLEAQLKSLSAKHQSEVSTFQADASRLTERARTQMAKRERELAAQFQLDRKQLAAAGDEQIARLQTELQSVTSQRDAVIGARETDLTAFRLRHERELQELDARKQREMAEILEERASLGRETEAMRAKHERSSQEQMARHEKAMAGLRAEHQTVIEGLTASNRTVAETQSAVTNARLIAELASIKADRDRVAGMLTSQEQRANELAARLEIELFALRVESAQIVAEAHDHMDVKIAEMKAQFAEERTRWEGDRDQAFKALALDHERELASKDLEIREARIAAETKIAALRAELERGRELHEKAKENVGASAEAQEAALARAQADFLRKLAAGAAEAEGKLAALRRERDEALARAGSREGEIEMRNQAAAQFDVDVAHYRQRIKTVIAERSALIGAKEAAEDALAKATSELERQRQQIMEERSQLLRGMIARAGSSSAGQVETDGGLQGETSKLPLASGSKTAA